MIHVEKNGDYTVIRIKSDMAAFEELVQRGANLWPDAPPEIKHFADVITSGKAQQDYFANPNLAGKASLAI